jgi:hypothetical protein
MADRYWVGGTAAWDGTAGTKWSTTSGGAGGASVPTTADNVFFDAASGAVVATITTESGTAAKSINCTGFTGTLASTVVGFPVHGSLTLSATMTATSLSFDINATGTVTTAGKTLTGLTIAASGGTVTLGGALTVSGALTVTSGTFTTSASNYAVTANQLVANGASVKTITLNASTVTLSSASIGSAAFNYTGSSLTFNAGTSTINLSAPLCRLDAGAGLTFNNVALTSTSTTTAARQIDGVNTFAQLTLAAPASSTVSVYEFHANQTATTLVAAGASVLRRIFLTSDVTGTRRTLTVTTWSSITDVDFRDIGMNSSRSGTRLGNCGNNNNVTFAAAKTVYWNLTGSQNWSSTGWATTSGGTPAVNNFPLAQDTVIFDNTGAATTVSIDANWNIGVLNMSARTTAMTLSGAGGPTVYGNWTCGTGVTQSITNTVIFNGIGTQTITSAGKSFFRIACQNPSGTVSLADAFTTTDTASGVTVISATFNANTFSVTTAVVSTASATIGLGTGTWTVSGTGNCWNCQSSAVTGAGEIILSNNTTTARTFLGQTSSSYGKLTIGGNTSTSTTTITGVTLSFSEIASTKTVAHTIVFPNTTTTVGAFTVQGSAGNVVTLSRTGASGTFTLAKSGVGVVGSNYLSISNSTASPSNTWYAGANSTDGGNNTGWIFANAPSASGNFFMFF